MNDESIICKGPPYTHTLSVAEFQTEKISKVVPQFKFKGSNETVTYLCKLFDAHPTDALYFYYGATAREHATKSLTNLYWNGNVTLFDIVEYDGSDLLFTVQVKELREPFIKRLVLKGEYNREDLVMEPFATFLSDPNLAARHKKYISAKKEKGKTLVSVKAENVKDALKIWLAFLDENKGPNHHYIQLQTIDYSITQLCRLLAPLMSNFKF